MGKDGRVELTKKTIKDEGRQASLFPPVTLKDLDAPMRVVRFETNEGMLDVDIRGGIEGLPAPVAAIVRNIVEVGGKNFSFVVRSAMHKEIRRGDVLRALRWARVFEALDGSYKVKKYIKNILFEETRNIRLLDEWRSLAGKDYLAMVAALTTSPKKWEMPERGIPMLEGYFRGYAEQVLVKSRCDFDEDRVRGVLVNSGNSDEMFAALWALRFRNDPAEKRIALLQEAFSRRAMPPWGVRLLTSDWDSMPGLIGHTPHVMIEVATGHWSEKAIVYSPAAALMLDDQFVTVPSLPQYVYDNHTRVGYKNATKYLRQVKPGEKSPPQLDLRWSGLLRGVCWRHYAFDQFGPDYVNTPWESVRIPEEVWRHVHMVDGWSYEKLYRSMGITDVPFPRSEDPENEDSRVCF